VQADLARSYGVDVAALGTKGLGRSSANAPGRRIVGGDGKARFNEPDGERGRAFVPAMAASFLPHAVAALGTKGLGAASRLMVAWLTP